MLTKLLWLLFPGWCQRVIQNSERRVRRSREAKVNALVECMVERVFLIVNSARVAQSSGLGEEYAKREVDE